MLDSLHHKTESHPEGLAAPAVSPATQAQLAVAADRLLQEGPAAALRFLTENADLADQAVLRRMQAIVFLHRERIEAEAGVAFLQQAVFDPIFCYCSICHRYWSISPLFSSPAIAPEDLQSLIAKTSTKYCPACGKGYCRRCAATAGKDCTCGANLEPLIRPNGRRPMQQELPREAAATRQPGLRNERPLRTYPNLHLYFGTQGKVPIAIDPDFPLDQPAGLEAHLDWAEVLFDAGQYYQAQQQLDLLGPAAEQIGRGVWLRARLRWVQLRNLHAGQRAFTQFAPFEEFRDRTNEIPRLLAQACQQDPQNGRIWLTRAEACLEPTLRQVDPGLALEYAQTARQLLGNQPDILYTEGQALYQTGQFEAAQKTLRAIPPDAANYAEAQQQATIADLASRCQAQPVDVQAHLQYGYWLWWHRQRSAAQPIFDRLLEADSGCAESLFVQGLRAWHNIQDPQRFNLAHRYLRQALDQHPDFGLAYQYLGMVYQDAEYSYAPLDFQPDDPLEAYQRAITHDPTCDLALDALGELAIKRSELPAALAFFEQAAALDTTSHNVYLHLAAIYKGLRKFEKEEWAYRKAKQIEPLKELTNERVDHILSLCNFEY